MHHERHLARPDVKREDLTYQIHGQRPSSRISMTSAAENTPGFRHHFRCRLTRDRRWVVRYRHTISTRPVDRRLVAVWKMIELGRIAAVPGTNSCRQIFAVLWGREMICWVGSCRIRKGRLDLCGMLCGVYVIRGYRGHVNSAGWKLTWHMPLRRQTVWHRRLATSSFVRMACVDRSDRGAYGSLVLSGSPLQECRPPVDDHQPALAWPTAKV